jgi:uncharacterized membrane protein
LAAPFIVIAMLAGFGLVAKGHYKMSTEEERVASSNRLKNWLFLPALMIPVVTVIGTLFLKGVSIGGVYLLDQKQLTLAALCVACVAAILTGWWLTKGTPLYVVRQSRRLVDTIGWAVILPQMLAMLGGVFVVANTGESVQKVVSLFVNPDSRFMLVVIYCVGMALFTMIMGNAFAAFPVLSAGIALPFLINVHHGNPAPLLAIGIYRRLLRHADDADGRQLQHCARRAAGAKRQISGYQDPDPDRVNPAGGERVLNAFPRVSLRSCNGINATSG